ncbi:hypothetical protein M409DRAFT_71587 [Zasmidium cellare ATCC 36951]|uniref:MPR-like GPCR protein n=1 Tax=Zasmidium cellare ATCC 36951 TaxID=1080233 RepID=A0A6A6BVI6_ZASCE|nr:uncharacterized protein M409DRAFT_71587 [Zasmidium cellare ATCC 36951]KAF2158543.1 hypothetical protein M409DRAFT_71587 [Zasmidium cellare ATCC 36951]
MTAALKRSRPRYSSTDSTTSGLLSWHEVPVWQQDNEYIVSGYRPTSGSVRMSIASLASWNNQTVNSYSHLIGAAIFAVLPFYYYAFIFVEENNALAMDLVVMCVYCYGVTTCFIFSAMFHTLWNHSDRYARLYNKLDYLGVLVLMWGAGIPTIFYGFLCDNALRSMYCMVTTSTAMFCTYLTLSPQFASPRFRRWRACFFAGYGLSSMMFVMHGLLLYGWEIQKTRMSLSFAGWVAVFNLIGAAIYATRIPERWCAYSFDIIGASHQIFHMTVIVAAWIHFRGIVEAFSAVRATPSTCHN